MIERISEESLVQFALALARVGGRRHSDHSPEGNRIRKAPALDMWIRDADYESRKNRRIGGMQNLGASIIPSLAVTVDDHNQQIGPPMVSDAPQTILILLEMRQCVAGPASGATNADSRGGARFTGQTLKQRTHESLVPGVLTEQLNDGASHPANPASTCFRS